MNQTTQISLISPSDCYLHCHLMFSTVQQWHHRLTLFKFWFSQCLHIDCRIRQDLLQEKEKWNRIQKMWKQPLVNRLHDLWVDDQWDRMIIGAACGRGIFLTHTGYWSSCSCKIKNVSKTFKLFWIVDVRYCNKCDINVSELKLKSKKQK